MLIARLLKLFFHLLYHPFAWGYDTVATIVSVGRWRHWVICAADLVASGRVLELGYGPGHLQHHLQQRGQLAVGLDESMSMARQASRRLRSHGFHPALVRGIAQSLPYATGSFDHVVATFPTPYIFDPHTVAEIRRVLRPDGQLVILLAAWITGHRLPDRAAALLFQLTGQVPPAKEYEGVFIEKFAQAGFLTRLQWVEQDSSRLLFVVANPHA